MQKLKKLLDFGSERKGLVGTVLFTLAAFFIVFHFILPVKYNNLGGEHSWLSGSTIKFVNNWLEEGAANLNFTNYELPNSIESSSPEDRIPYLSYPSGETFFVYISARALGKKTISVSFLHKFQVVMFAIEAVMFSLFVYIFMTHTLKNKNIIMKAITATLTGLLWMLLPTTSYYLANIYYADQSVILWVMGILLLELVLRSSDNKKNTFLKILRALVIYSGLLIDYYFWFLAFFMFVFEIVGVFYTKKKGERKKTIILISLWFVIPALLAVGTFLLQLIQTNDWIRVMIDRFNVRVNGTEEQTLRFILTAIWRNFYRAIANSNIMIWYVVAMLAFAVITSLVVAIRKKKIKVFFTDPGVSIIVCNAVAIIAQIAFFKQHSAIHEFSMIKVAWIIAMLPLILAMLVSHLTDSRFDKKMKLSKWRVDKFYMYCLPSILIVFLAAGIPVSSISFTKSRVQQKSYELEKIIYKNFDYDDVLYSFTEEIPHNPPQSLAISHKRVYKIDNVDELDKKFDLPEEANRILIINKVTEVNDGIKPNQKCLKKNGESLLETERYLFVNVNNFKKCIK